jgi:hypothetical protein
MTTPSFITANITTIIGFDLLAIHIEGALLDLKADIDVNM